MTALCGLCSFICPGTAPFFSEPLLFYRHPPKPSLRFSPAPRPRPRPGRMFVPLSAYLLVTSSSQVIVRMYAACTNTDVLTTSPASESRFQMLRRHLFSVAVQLLRPHFPRISGGSSPTCSFSREVHFKGKGSQASL